MMVVHTHGCENSGLERLRELLNVTHGLISESEFNLEVSGWKQEAPEEE